MPKFCIFGTGRMKAVFPLDETTDTEVKVGKAVMCSCWPRCAPTWVYKASRGGGTWYEGRNVKWDITLRPIKLVFIYLAKFETKKNI